MSLGPGPARLYRSGRGWLALALSGLRPDCARPLVPAPHIHRLLPLRVQPSFCPWDKSRPPRATPATQPCPPLDSLFSKHGDDFFFFFFASLTPFLCQPSPIKCFCPLPCLGIDLAFVDNVPYRATGSWRAGQALATAGPGPRGGGPPTLTEHPSSCSGGRGTWAVTFAFCTLSVPKRDKNTSQACRRIRWAAPSM